MNWYDAIEMCRETRRQIVIEFNNSDPTTPEQTPEQTPDPGPTFSASVTQCVVDQTQTWAELSVDYAGVDTNAVVYFNFIGINYYPDQQLDASFNPIAWPPVQSVFRIIVPDGTTSVGGAFSAYDGTGALLGTTNISTANCQSPAA